MNDLIKEYYENDQFWVHTNIGVKDKIRIEKTYELLPQDITNLLDAGCGNGKFCNYTQNINPKIKITGLDSSNSALKHVLTNKIVGDITNIPFKDNEFDCITCLEVIEHLTVNNYKKALSELARVSNKYIIISVPFNEKIDKNVTKCPSCGTIFNTDLHFRNFNNNDLQILFTEFDYSCISTTTTGSIKKNILLHYLVRIKNSALQGSKLKNKFNSPICPLCGFKNINFKIQTQVKKTSIKNNQTALDSFRKFISKIWPKRKTKDYWIIALYQKNSKK